MAFLAPLLVGPLAELAKTVLTRVLPAEKVSEAERLKIENEMILEIAKMDFGALMAQVQVNLKEAEHDSVFVAGWRPYIGWVCGTGLAYHYVAQPFMTWVIAVIKWQVPPLPTFDMSTLVTLLMGMLGLGVARTVEKLKGAAGQATGAK